jgi:capsular polysaccharide biosynthesis protein
MTRHKPEAPSVGLREIIRWWPLVVVVTLIAFGGAMWSEARQVQTYSATTTVLLMPLPQWEETFLGTSLLHDTGDAARTTSTAAAMLDSPRAAALTADYLGSGWTPDSVAEAVTVSPRADANVVEVVAQARQADQASKLSEGYVKAVLENRWKTIASELDARITTIKDTISATPDNPNVEAQYQLVQTLQLVRDGGSDFTMKIDSTSQPVQTEQLSLKKTVALATVGGLCVGLFAAAGAALLRSRTRSPAVTSTKATPSPVHSRSEGF